MAVEPLEMFAQVTTALTELGLTDQQLSSIRYTGKHSQPANRRMADYLGSRNTV